LFSFVKFIILAFDEETSEFATFAIFNFENQDELKLTGKRFPQRGMLRTVSTHWFCGFGFLADDTIFTWVQLQETLQPLQMDRASSLNITRQQSSTFQYDDKNQPKESTKHKLNEKYLNAMAGPSQGHLIEQLVKPMNHCDLRKFGVQAIIDIQLVE